MNAAPATILIVDDEIHNRKLLEALLQHKGYRTLVAVDGESALVCIDQQPPDLILLDVMMPGIDGYEVARTLKQNPSTAPIPIILLTALDEQAARLAGLESGAEDFLTKPVDRAELWLRTRNLLRLKSLGDFLQDHNSTLEQEVLERTRDIQRFHAAMDTTADAIYLVDYQDMAVVEVNTTACAMLGYSREELLGASPTLVTGGSPSAMRHALDRIIAGDGDAAAEIQVRRKDGSWFDAELRQQAQGSAENRIIVCVLRDISERKRAAETLLALSEKARLREQILSASLSSMVDFAYIFDRQGRFLFANKPLLDLWGLELEEAVGKDFSDLGYPPLLAERLAHEIQTVFEINKSVSGETPFTDLNGVENCYEYILSPVPAPDGSVEFVVGSTRDISDRKQAATLLETRAREQRALAEELGAERTRLLEAQGIGKIGSWETDLQTMDVAWSEEAHRIHETDPAMFQPTHADFLERVHPEDRVNLDRAFHLSLDSCVPSVLEHRLLFPDGRVKFVEERWKVVFDRHGTALRVAGTCQDISERKSAEFKIHRLNRVYAVISQVNALVVRVKDTEELFHQACRIAVEDGGFRLAWVGIVDRQAMQVVPVASAGASRQTLEQIRERLSLQDGAILGHGSAALAVRAGRAVVVNDVASDSRVRRRQFPFDELAQALVSLPLVVDGIPVAVLNLHASVKDFFDREEMELLEGLARDLAYAMDHISKQDKLNHLAFYDELTGLANRSLFLERVAQHLRAAAVGARGLAVLIIDLERFKNINDSLGRNAGDSLLVQVADWLTQNVGPAALASRLGADQFAIVLPELAGIEGLEEVIEEKLAAFSMHSFRVNDSVLRISAKIGVSVFPADGDGSETLFRHAEAALKKAKARGHRYLFYSAGMTDKVAARLTMENQLRKALDSEEYVLHYQPKIALSTGALVGAEALIRWNDPMTGLVAPGLFIPILEETGLIHEVGRWALRKALDDYLRWRRAGLPAVRIAVNVSTLQLHNRGFVAEVAQSLSIDSQACDGLELEITESMIMDDMDNSVASLRSIRDMGVRIAIDDFGTGFSSLSYLSKLPVHTLKIDRSFVVEMAEEPDSQAVVATIISLGRSLRLDVVAEGVETEQQAAWLRELGCDQMQGYLVSRPVPADDFEKAFLR